MAPKPKSKSKSKNKAVKTAARAAAKAPRKGEKAEPEDAAAEESAVHRKLESVLQEVTAKPEKTHIEQMVPVQCPYCGEEFEVHVTSEEDGQSMTEDCHVCCRPISIHVTVEDEEIQVSAFRS